MKDCCGEHVLLAAPQRQQPFHSFEHKHLCKSILFLRPRYSNKSGNWQSKSKFKVSHAFQHWNNVTKLVNFRIVLFILLNSRTIKFPLQCFSNSLFSNSPPHNTLCLPPPPPKFCINYCFQMLLGTLHIHKSIWKQWFMQNLGGKQSVLWGIRK